MNLDIPPFKLLNFNDIIDRWQWAASVLTPSSSDSFVLTMSVLVATLPKSC